MNGLRDTEVDFPAPLRAMVVDDHPRNRQIMRALLELCDCAPSCVASGEEAVDLAAKSAFDLIIMDHTLGGMNGDEAARRVRSRGASRLASILRWTTDPPSPLDPALYDGDLAKPVVLHDLRAAVAGVRIGERQQQRLAAERACEAGHEDAGREASDGARASD